MVALPIVSVRLISTVEILRRHYIVYCYLLHLVVILFRLSSFLSCLIYSWAWVLLIFPVPTFPSHIILLAITSNFFLVVVTISAFAVSTLSMCLLTYFYFSRGIPQIPPLRVCCSLPFTGRGIFAKYFHKKASPSALANRNCWTCLFCCFQSIALQLMARY